MEEELLERINRLERELKSAKYLFIFLILMFIMLAYQYLSVQRKRSVSADLVRTRSLILVDNEGMDAVLMGYPVPSSEKRIRNEPMDGILMLDRNGNDRIFMGRTESLQKKGELYNRIDAGWGYLVNDRDGNERGNLSILDSLNSMVLGLNYPVGEGIMLVSQPGSSFMVINADSDGPQRERIILKNEQNGNERTFLQIGNKNEVNEPVIIRPGLPEK